MGEKTQSSTIRGETEKKMRRLNTSAAAFSSLKNDGHEARLATPWKRIAFGYLGSGHCG